MEYNGIQQTQPISSDTWTRWNTMMCSTSNLVTVRLCAFFPLSAKSKRSHTHINTHTHTDTHTHFILNGLCIDFRTWLIWRISPFEWNSNWPRFRYSAQSFVWIQLYKVHIFRSRFSKCLFGCIRATFFRVCRMKLIQYSQSFFALYIFFKDSKL